MSVLLPIVGGIVFRQLVLAGLGSALLAMNLPPELSEQIVAFVSSLGPVGGSIVGGGLIVASLGWSFWQKKKSGALDPK